MGYYTCFKLTTDANTDKELEIIKDLRDNNEDAEFAIDENGKTTGDSKWYLSEEDLREFSKKYPHVLFTLEGIGEMPDDIWRLYVRNGLAQRANAEIVYPDYDPEKMK